MRNGFDWKAFRRRLGMTQRQVAEAVGVSVPAVTRWESGFDPSPAHLMKLAELARQKGLEGDSVELCSIVASEIGLQGSVIPLGTVEEIAARSVILAARSRKLERVEQIWGRELVPAIISCLVVLDESGSEEARELLKRCADLLS